MEALPPSAPDRPFPPAAQDRLDPCKALAGRHPRLDLVEREGLHALWAPAGCAYLLVYGPSGVGKSTMLHPRVRRLPTPARGPGHRCLRLLAVRPPAGVLLHRTASYRTARRHRGQPSFERRLMVDLTAAPAWEHKGGRRTAARYHDAPALRDALEEALRTQPVRAVVLEQLDGLKSMPNVPGGLPILLGPSSRGHFCKVPGQTARRGLAGHWPRSHFREESECQALRNGRLPLRAQGPRAGEQAALLPPWPYFDARSLGCVGVLKAWLGRATALARRAGSDALTRPPRERRALSEAQGARMAAAIQEGEQAGPSSAAHCQRLLALLGRRARPTLTAGPAMPRPAAARTHTGARAAPPPPPLRPRVGQRQPPRAPVGARGSPASPTQGLGAGPLDVDARGLPQSAITQGECPVWGAGRPGQCKAQRVLLPAHAPRKTPTTCQGARWLKGETGWARAQPCGGAPGPRSVCPTCTGVSCSGEQQLPSAPKA